MITIENIQKSIRDAKNLISKLPIEISQYHGLSSQKIRHLLNNLCSFSDVKYLNVGVYTGSSFWSAIYHNSLKATAIDWWRNDSAKQDETYFYKNLAEILAKETQTQNRELNIINQDCFTVELKDKYNIYFYDGGHSEENQYKALTYFDKYLENKFILLVDDFDDEKVKNGTIRAIQELKYDIEFIWEAEGEFGNWNPDSLTWWNGFLVCLINKT